MQEPQPRPTWWKWVGLGVGVVVFLALIPVVVGLAGGGSSDNDDPYQLPVKPADYVGYDVYGANAGSKDFPAGQAYLAGPNFSVDFNTLEISAYSSLDFHAAAGDEFLRMTVRDGGHVDSSADGLTAQIVVDAKARPVQLAKAAQTGLIVSVPKGHTAILRVTDEGRTQSLDLRTGKRGSDAISGYYPQHVLNWQNSDYDGNGDSNIDGCRRFTKLSLGFSPENSALLPWGPDLGWATPGRAWLPISYVALVRPTTLPDYDSFADMPPTCGIDRVMEWDLAGSVAVQTPQGEVAPTRVIPNSTNSAGTLVYDVPASLTSGTLVVHPAVTYQGRKVAWTTAPQTARTEMSGK